MLPPDHRFYRRRFPHYQSDSRKYFVTAVTFQRWILPPAARDLVMAEINRAHGTLMWCCTAVVMPDHLHLVMMPLWNGGWAYALADVMKAIKGASARWVNLNLGRSGPVWQREYFDHEIRNDESLTEKCDYVRENPVRKGLVARAEDYPWLFEPIREESN